MCDKRQYTKKEAQTFLNEVRKGLRRYKNRKEKRAYQCPECNYWHVSSKA